MDEDGDGRISVEELGAGLNSVGIKMPGYQIREMVVHVDQDKDGFMNLEELKLVSISVDISFKIGRFDSVVYRII